MLKEKSRRKETWGAAHRKLDSFWVSWLHHVFTNDPELTIVEIAQQAEDLARELGRTDFPHRSTVHRYLDAFRNLDEDVKRQYREFRWPDSMEDGDLPWEASTEALALLEWTGEYNLRPPTVNLVVWYWRTTLMLPDTPLDLRLRVAITLATHREIGEPIPERLRKDLAISAVLDEYRPQVVSGGPSAIWAAEVTAKAAFEPEFKRALFASAPSESWSEFDLELGSMPRLYGVSLSREDSTVLK